VDDRRRFDRTQPGGVALLAAGPEAPLGEAEIIDASIGGVLFKLGATPPPVREGDAMLCSFSLPDGHLYVLGSAARLEVGEDHSYYLAMQLRELDGDDENRLTEAWHLCGCSNAAP
jgi:hypothetical protein